MTGCVLIATHAEDALRPVVDALKKEGVSLVFASSGTEAARQTARVQPDVILLERNLPDMDAIDVCRDLRLDPELSELPVMILVDALDRETRMAALESGVDHVLPRNIDQAELCERIQNVLRLNRFRKMAELRAQLQRARVGLRFIEAATAPDPLLKNFETPPTEAAQASNAGKRTRTGLASRGARGQFLVGLSLTSFIPSLAMIFVLFTHRALPEDHFLTVALWPVLALTGVLMVLGVWILAKYPRNIVRMRRYLEGLAVGRLPDGIELSEDEDDLRAIEFCMHLIIRQTEERIRMIQRHEEALRIAERQRVMIESLGTACHHLGQPVTVMSVLMHLIEKKDMSDELRKMVRQGCRAATELCHLLKRLQSISHYRTESYRAPDGTGSDRVDEFILDVPDAVS